MKSYSLILLMFLALHLNAQKKSGKITYEIANIDFKDDGKNADGTVMLAMAKRQLYELKFNKNFSSFQMIDQMQDESFSDFHNVLAKIYVSNFDYYFDYSNSQLLEVNRDGTIIEQKISKLPWEITSESKMIGNYQCYKATYTLAYLARDYKTKTRLITAWFAPSLPLSFGPKNHHGLPGLILELTDSTITFLASKVELYNNDIEVKMPAGKRISNQEMEEIQKNY